MITFLLANIVPILMVAGGSALAAFLYGKGRKHATAKADRELDEAVEVTQRDADIAIAAGDREPDELRKNDGFKRDE